MGNPGQDSTNHSANEYGAFCRSHKCPWSRSVYFYMLGCGCMAGGLFFLAKFPDLLAPAIFGIGGLLLVFAGWRNSTACLNLYEEGMAFTDISGHWKCRYRDIGQLLIHSQSVNGAKMPVGLEVVMKDGKKCSAKAISGVRKAADFIVAKM